MARLNSFYCNSDIWPASPGDMITLQDEEARHMLTVLRTGTGETVRLFDGMGRDGIFVVRETARKQATLEAIELNQLSRPKNGLTLAIGWGKSKRRNYLFEKLVEFQADGVVFWSAERSQGHVPHSVKSTWNDKCIQAAKQCGNPYLPSISIAPDGVDDLLRFADSFDQCYLAWESDQAVQPLTPDDLGVGKGLIVIGPEGGMTDDEATRLVEGGFKPVTLGNSILRWETAATYCLSLSWYARQVAS